MPINILFLSSNPHDTEKLRLNREIHEIEKALRQSKNREQFIFIPKVAVQIDDLQREIRQSKASIVHFSGHGVGDRGLVLENYTEKQDLVNNRAIADLFKLFEDRVECLVLNACNSEAQAKEISQHINYVIYTKKQIKDEAAIAFSIGFYEALGDGESFERAFEFGCNRIQLKIYKNKSDRDRQLVPVFSEEEKTWIDLPQHEVLDIATKEPLTVSNKAIATEINFEEVSTALVSGYRNYRELKRLTRLKLAINLQEIASDTLPIADVVLDLIEWAESNGTITDLISAAYKEKPNNAQIKDIYDRYVC
ncbi:MAG: effector-associated domain EAD1-containing protein [Cyanobacteria bacterium J06621_8]